LFSVPIVAQASAAPSGDDTKAQPASPAASMTALGRLRDEVERLALPMETPGAAHLRAERERVLRLLDDYVGQRLRRRDGPMLVVIGGPTGAGKSTLMNSLAGARVSAAGVLRPTTAEPVLVYNPADGPAFFRRRLLPNLMATTASGRDPLNPGEGGQEGATAMRLVPSEDLAPGLAMVDSPDFDSYRVANRDLAADLLDVADLWLYVTTGTDYANAVPWDFLRVAAGRRLSVATVLNRMRPAEIELVGADLTRLLGEHGLGDAPMFVIPEVALQQELIPVHLVEPLWRWLDQQATSPEARRGYVDRAVDGTIDEVVSAVERLSDAASDQVVADRRLRVDLRASFRRARNDLREAVFEGSIDLSHIEGAGRHAEPLRTRRAERIWRRLGGLPRGDGHHGATDALAATLAGFARREVQTATARVAERWSIHPAATSIGLERILDQPAGFDEQIDVAVRGWLDDVAAATFGLMSAVEQQAGQPTPPGASFRTASLALMPPRGDGDRYTGLYTDPASGVQRPVQSGAQPPAELLDRLRANLVERLSGTLTAEETRLEALLEAVSQNGGTALREAGAALRQARNTERDA
jgi:energy-coupling factor transporter ATP-binding protein EcfA2